MQNKSDKDIKAYVADQRKKRDDIQKEIQTLNAKRKTFITKKKKENSTNNALENAMIGALKKQAKRKNYKWKN